MPRGPAPPSGWRLTLLRRKAQATIAPWLQGHPHLRAKEAREGEPTVALLILWEVDHGWAWPSVAAEGDWVTLSMGFCGDLRQVLAGDPGLASWFTRTWSHRPLADGLKVWGGLGYAVGIDAAVGPEFHAR